jgi:hypothetical protein
MTATFTIEKINNNEYIVYKDNQIWSKNKGVDINGVIQSVINAGAKHIILKKGITWTPQSNFIPGNLIVEGEDADSVIIKAANPDLDFIIIGPNTMLVNVSIHDKSGVIEGLSPNVPRPVKFYYNARNTNSNPSHWFRQFIVVDTGEPNQPIGSPLRDNPAIAVNQYGIGDAYWAGVNDNGNGFHVHVNETNPTKSGIGILVALFGQGKGILLQTKPSAGGVGLHIIPESPNAIPLFIEDVITVLNVPDLAITCNKRTTGSMINLYHDTSNYSGEALTMNLGGGTGNFTGKFMSLYKAGTRKFSIDHEGRIYAGGIENSPGFQKGINVSVPAGATFIDITLPIAEPDANYGVVVTPQWNTTVWITNKNTTGFRINFGIAPTVASALDWFLFR